MALQVAKAAVCDRCGKSVPVSTEFDDAYSVVTEANKAGESGWERAGADRILCPSCAPSYRELLRKQEAEIEAFFAS